MVQIVKMFLKKFAHQSLLMHYRKIQVLIRPSNFLFIENHFLLHLIIEYLPLLAYNTKFPSSDVVLQILHLHLMVKNGLSHLPELFNALIKAVVNTEELFPHTNWPVHRIGLNAKHFFKFFH